MLTNTQKTNIAAAAKKYAASHELTQQDCCNATAISNGYLSQMFNNKFSAKVNNKDTPIGDKWFHVLAAWCHYSIAKRYWDTIHTPQYKQIIPALEQTKATTKVSIIITDTGLGKSYIVDQFMKHSPVHTYKITVSSLHKLPDILRELLSKLNINVHGNSTAAKLAAIIGKLTDLNRNGYNPLIILDEAENLKQPVLAALKALYDGINGQAGMVLIGTDQLLNSLHKLRHKNKIGMPQFYRRVKAGIKLISTTVDFAPFFAKHNIDKPLQKLLLDLCDNYGELNDYLEPALREADEKGVPLTEQLFRLIYNIPQLKTA